jgi:hypothetical protein
LALSILDESEVENSRAGLNRFSLCFDALSFSLFL